MPSQLVIITGLSGSGKSTVGKCFEDLGYYCVDNLPLKLLKELLHNPFELIEGHDRIAIVTDVRAPGFALEFPELFKGIDRATVEPTLLFLEASDEVLVRRFSETRRPHPLALDRPVFEGIQSEREILSELRGLADKVLDSSEWSIHEIRNQVYRDFAGSSDQDASFVVSLVSFGFKYGIPYGTDLLFDVRFLPNPHFVPGLKEQTGQQEGVRSYLEEQAEYRELAHKLEDFLLYLLPKYSAENRTYLSIAIGCTGGRHRSVALVELLCDRLAEADWAARPIHRDIRR